MADNSAIEWTDATWNFLAGCTPVSEGCRNCYAASIAHIRGHNPLPVMRAKYSGTARMTAPGPNRRAVFTGKITVDEAAMTKPLTWKRGRKIFVNSMSDLFHPDVPAEVVDRAFAVMALCQHHTFQVLTKRPERMAEYVTGLVVGSRLRDGMQDALLNIQSGTVEGRNPHESLLRLAITMGRWPWPLPNVWLGTSVENQDAADERIPHLLATPAAVRFLSCEPLLGPLDLERVANPWGEHGATASMLSRIHWVIGGGESGHGARPLHPSWARSLRDQCKRRGIPFFWKQWGEFGLTADRDRPGRDMAVAIDGQVGCSVYELGAAEKSDVPGFPSWTMMYRVGKKAAGRLLDGREWNQFPATAEVSR